MHLTPLLLREILVQCFHLPSSVYYSKEKPQTSLKSCSIFLMRHVRWISKPVCFSWLSVPNFRLKQRPSSVKLTNDTVAETHHIPHQRLLRIPKGMVAGSPRLLYREFSFSSSTSKIYNTSKRHSSFSNFLLLMLKIFISTMNNHQGSKNLHSTARYIVSFPFNIVYYNENFKYKEICSFSASLRTFSLIKSHNKMRLTKSSNKLVTALCF